MKNTRLTKLLAVCLSLVLIVGAVALVAVLAGGSSGDATTDKVGIASINLSFGDKHQLVYAVRADEDYLNETNGKVGLMFWNYNPEADGEKSAEELYRSAQDRVFSTHKEMIGDEELYIISSSGIALDSLASDVYVCPIVKHVEVSNAPGSDGEDITYSFSYTKGYTQQDGETVSYAPRAASVMRYALQKITEIAIDTTDEEYIADADAYLAKLNNKLTMYTKLANLSNSAAEQAGDSRVFGIIGGSYGAKATGALFDSFAAKDNPYNFIDVTALESTQNYILRADAHTAEGYFLGWVDHKGNVVSASRIAQISMSNAGYILNGVTYTYDDAVTTIAPAYGDVSVSNFTNTFDIGSGESLVSIGTHTTKEIKTEGDNGYYNYAEYVSKGGDGENKISIASNVSSTIKEGAVYAIEFDFRINELVNAVYEKDSDGKYTTVTNSGSSWWSYMGFGDGSEGTYGDNDGVAISNTAGKTSAITLTNGTAIKFFQADNLMVFGKAYKPDDYDEWVTVRVELEIKKIENGDVTELEERFYVNGTLLTTKKDAKNSKGVYYLQEANGITYFYIKTKAIGAAVDNSTDKANASNQKISVFDMDFDNISVQITEK